MTYKMNSHALDMRLTKLLAVGLCAIATAITGFAQPPGILNDASALANAGIIRFHASPHDLRNGNAHSRFGIFGIDSIPNFNGQFVADGFDPVGNPNRHWYANTAGNPPQMGGTTVINAPIKAINVELDDADGAALPHMPGNLTQTSQHEEHQFVERGIIIALTPCPQIPSDFLRGHCNGLKV